MSASPRTIVSIIGYTLVALLVVVGGSVAILSKFEPQKSIMYQTVNITARGPSSVSDTSAARSEPIIEIQLADGQTRHLPNLYYALHPELEIACLSISEGSYSGARKLALVPMNMCNPP
ncbi:hypothetical protein BCF46_1119 [Litoreibacter meonggei]|uniref:Uncharacterized protein n=1 Tax=Litoreibacter meonggei TaxID=1049199 RepID=A0A497WY09_9RHOB|nr:hypothetical protein [Litoreibacter meonggei]RLJ58978.1 hypothetical protein BCF46_1119 [Litoreibacter meonggei]